MTIPQRYLPLILFALCGAACSGPQGAYILESDRHAAEEAEANLAALRELVARNRARTPEPQAPADLELIVMEPITPVVLNEDGAILRSALDTFFEGGPHAVLGAATLEPARDDGGSPIGFRIEALHVGSEFITAAGIGVGDVVTTVNGHSILMPDGFIDAWESLAEAESISIDVIRDGPPETLVWDVANDVSPSP
jgi:hypothetical protein